MLGGVGGRHASVRRRGSSPGVHLRRDISPPVSPRPMRRRRAVAVSDHKTCALIHTRLKLGDIMLVIVGIIL
ncbi:unnamed protein product [Pieris brassicae]|uniref:Uncharacterized protein n=1 Tax=Pieris brassicae TaxID=7116 RepID=A0A9P0T8Y3_PIEBR|nr:unnamed protein product [Pieris brassicae]